MHDDEPEETFGVHPMYLEGFHDGRRGAESVPIEALRTMSFNATPNPSMGRGLWLNTQLARLARESPEEVQSDVKRLAAALGRYWTTAGQTDPQKLGRELAVVTSAADQIAAYTEDRYGRDRNVGDATSIRNDTSATEYARGFLEAIADHLAG